MEETLTRLSAGAIKADGSKVLKLKYSLPVGQNASGRRVEADIDADGMIDEANEGNNVVERLIP